MITASNLSSSARLRHGFFTREGGTSGGLFDSLNCGFGSGDDAANVAANRQSAMARLGCDADDLATLYQVHSGDALIVDRPWPAADRPRADAMATRRPGVALGILTADCAPVLFADTDAGVIGAAHAGWKGALGGVLGATVEAMESLGASRARTAAALGPCIRQESYEVGPEFHDAFVAADSANSAYFEPSGRPGHQMFDLAGYVVDRLRGLGLASVDDVAIDTYVEDARFFSYRRATHRGEPDYGRGLSAIVMEDA
ncbi:MAG: peptidoglycan editing factor PgeF [Magnetovibrio sp.]|nr:peptidoglycan editing factor PgeF [Magnetovibrio sp.]